MRAVLNSIITHPNYSRVFELGRLITMAGSAQIAIQAICLISGILIIRLLPTQEYALYTLANTMLGTLTILADGGISTGVMAQGGKVWQSREKLGAVLVTGLQLRKKFGLISLLLVSPVLFYLLRHHGASWLFSILIILSLIPAFFAALSDSLLETPLKLNQEIGRLQVNQVSVSTVRLLLITLSLFIFPWTFIAILGNGLPRIWANVKLKKIALEFADLSQKADILIQKEILSIVKRLLPTAMYYCLSGQITIWLISIFGSTTGVAQVGALSRLATVLTIFSAMFSTLLAPRFARLPENRQLLLRKFFNILLLVFMLALVIVSITSLFSKEILMLLGSEYAGLKYELVLSVTGGCIGLIAGICFSLCTQRGWAMNPVLAIILSIASIAVCASLIDISTLEGILIFNIFVALFQVVLHLFYSVYRMLMLRG